MTKNKSTPWYLRDQVTDDLKLAFNERLAISNANKTYLVCRLGVFFFLVFIVLDFVRYRAGMIQPGTIYFYLLLSHLSFVVYIIPLYFFSKNKKAIRAGTYPNKRLLTNATLFFLCISLLTVGTLSLVERGSLMVYAIFILLINLVFTLPHQKRLVINLIVFVTVCMIVAILEYSLGWSKISTHLIEIAGITFPAYLMATYQYNIASREFGNEKLIEQKSQELSAEKEKSDALLLNILPADIAKELKEKGKASARRHESVTILFSDFVNFSAISANVSPEELVRELDACFKGFDEIIERHQLEKIKTIGDAYLCLGGMTGNESKHAVNVVKAAFEIQSFLAKRSATKKTPPIFEARIGIHSGEVVSGVVGTKKFAFDVWGDHVNIAARIESSGEGGKVNISGATYEQIKAHYKCNYRGKLPIKNRGEIEMYFVETMI